MLKNSFIYFLLIFVVITHNLIAQDIVINEIMSSNSNYYIDEFGDSPDWIEIFNNGDQNVDLSKYYLSDKNNIHNKWNLPSIRLEPDSILFITASGRDISTTASSWETIINVGDSWIYRLGNSEPAANWKELGFVPTGWLMGNSGIGYGDDDDETVIIPQNSIYLIKEFDISNVENVSQLLFNIDYDDGFVAYINGQEIARENLGNKGEFIPYNKISDAAHEARLYRKLSLENNYFIGDFNSILNTGINVLAIQVHNFGINSSDLSAIPLLTIGYKSGGVNSVADEVIEFLPRLHTNFSISNGNEGVYLFDDSGNIIDSVGAIKLPTNFSYGRVLSDINTWSIFKNPSHGLPNPLLGYLGQTENPIINLPSGFYETNVNIEITAQSESVITYYTLDGSEPDTASILFGNQVTLDKTYVLKIKSFRDKYLPSETITNTYFINENSSLPVISLSTNPNNLWDYNEGIYVLGPNAEAAFPYFNANFWQDWRKHATFQLFDKNKIERVSIEADIKIFGGWSRANAQKSLSVFGINGDIINYKLFNDHDLEEFSSIVLRNSGNDWGSTMFRDGFIHSIANPLNFENQAFEPAVMFLNGEYWGIHNIREKINLNYLNSHYSVTKSNIDLLELDGTIIDGNNESYIELKEFISNNNLSFPSNFDVVKKQLDIDSFIDYQLFQIYIANTDWPGNNAKFWRDESINGKWRWILFDTDFGFGWDYGKSFNHNTLSFALQSNGPGWPNPPWSTLFLRKLIENESFKNSFINRFSDLSNSTLKASLVKSKLEKSTEKIKSEIPNHIEKWNQFSFTKWESNISKMRIFADLRIVYLDEYFKNQFGLSGKGNIELTISAPNSGKIKINTIVPQNYPWKGSYFIGQSLQLIPKPNPGYTFIGWSGDIISSKDTLIIDVNTSQTISANYKLNSNHPQVVINEINYNSSNSFDTEDWIELFNNSDEIIDLSNWILKDEIDSNQFVIKPGTNLSPNNYLILSRDTLSFRSYYKNNINLIGNFDFGLNNSGDLVRLFDSSGLLVDSLRYDDSDPWPAEADGSGSTLELINPELDNSSYSSWKNSDGFGTPSELNSTYITSVDQSDKIIPKNYSLLQNYPNPFNPTTIIEYNIPTIVNENIYSIQNVQLKIYDILGREVKVLVNEYQKPGNYEINYNAKDLTSGIYFYQLKAGEFKATKKMILLK